MFISQQYDWDFNKEFGNAFVDWNSEWPRNISLFDCVGFYVGF